MPDFFIVLGCNGGGIVFTVSLVFLAMKPHRGAETIPADVLNLCQCIPTIVLFTLLLQGDQKVLPTKILKFYLKLFSIEEFL